MTRSAALSGEAFGRLLVLKRAENNRKGEAQWLCACTCGRTVKVKTYSLRSGKTRSCGCLRKEQEPSTKNPNIQKYRAEYNSYNGLLSRCRNVNTPKYRNYGGRGISVCDRWLESFDNFLEDMGRKPSEEHSIDRRDNDGNYEPRNCRWATNKEQALNKSNTIFLTIRGETKPLKIWSELLNVSYDCLYKRLKRGQSFDDLGESGNA